MAAMVTRAAVARIDWAPLVGPSLAVMESDARRMRGPRPFRFVNPKETRGSPRPTASRRTPWATRAAPQRRVPVKFLYRINSRFRAEEETAIRT